MIVAGYMTTLIKGTGRGYLEDRPLLRETPYVCVLLFFSDVEHVPRTLRSSRGSRGVRKEKRSDNLIKATSSGGGSKDDFEPFAPSPRRYLPSGLLKRQMRRPMYVCILDSSRTVVLSSVQYRGNDGASRGRIPVASLSV